MPPLQQAAKEIAMIFDFASPGRDAYRSRASFRFPDFSFDGSRVFWLARGNLASKFRA
jgi:hypothetical protein